MRHSIAASSQFSGGSNTQTGFEEASTPSRAPSTIASGAADARNTEASARQPLSEKKGLPNMHIGLHLKEVAMEYGGCNMVFTLLGEDKHREFKADILHTNFHNAAATLIHRENYRLTVSFLLNGCFAITNPECHELFSIILRGCPTLCKSLNPRPGEDENNIEETSEIELISDLKHKDPIALHRVLYSKQDSVRDPLIGMRSTRGLGEEHEFCHKLEEAYKKSYGQSVFPHLESGMIQWSRKVSFATRRTERICFQLGDFIATRSSYARIMALFIHSRAVSRHLFAIVQFAVPRSGNEAKEFLLDVDIYDLEEERHIIGLPDIGDERLWMVPRYDGSFLFIDHNVYFM
ncbi:hypothetical protein N5P37_007824 [Trichoderma harzianum]|uniref:Uncharacterized protein n=1 Tax=Trichoderma harzianum CBS 226.95 TaxID=983964 RepID=A0A2T4A497_TRIHA|nr:hypothetical protein M431DRAFT_498065 [Trichoderma harzianum CBS 226.95]KAK0759636.1 hypothetical protein N5P37_007824 [Trichoderma harzianum]PTB51793.1 hypothetical protein M431DRAFT_498065 [Trichoderma harzianum CBS 226.95]